MATGMKTGLPPIRTIGACPVFMPWCSASVSDPAETADRRSPAILETFGRAGWLGQKPTAALRVAYFLRVA
jgi:hypothetical protein